MTTTTTTAGHGDDFTATAECSCGWSETFTLGDDGEMARTCEAAERAAAAHRHKVVDNRSTTL